MNARDYAESLNLQIGESRRSNCPSCGHKNTFSVTNNNGQILWNCFHADCSVKGRGDLRITRDNVGTIMSQIGNTLPKQTSEDLKVPFIKPKSWSRNIPPRGRDYVHLVNTSGRYDDIYFDVVRDRLVYPIYDNDGTLVDGAGRTMTGERPKWYRYGNYRGGFSIGTSDVAFVVEDIPSAISISEWVTGYALLGTALRDEHIEDLCKFKKVIIALDHDATDKALTMMREMSKLTTTGLLMLDQDLKTLGDEERERTIRSGIA